MSAASQILKNFNIYVDGRSYAGNCDEVQLPALSVVGEDYRAGGMDMPVEIDMGMEKLELTFKLSKFDASAQGLFGTGVSIPLTFRGAVEDLNGAVKALVVQVFGKVHGLETDAVSGGGGKVGQSFRMALTAYTYTLDDVVVHDIDALNMKRVINGVDRLAAQRAAIGL